jgi:hypothetical protein
MQAVTHQNTPASAVALITLRRGLTTALHIVFELGSLAGHVLGLRCSVADSRGVSLGSIDI